MLNPYMPRLAHIVDVVDETRDVKTFILRPESAIRFEPGQFIMISAFGVGEAPFAIASSPFRPELIEVSIRAVGNVTRALHRMEKGDVVGIRGPYGNGFPVDQIKGHNVVFIAGGTGIFGISSFVWYIFEKRDDFSDVYLLYGVRRPSLMMRRYDLEKWRDRIEVFLTVDVPEPGWNGHVGLVTDLLDRLSLPRHDVVFALCGPPLMIKFAYYKLRKMGYGADQIFVSLERNMKCGIGKCGRCMLSNGLYVCKDGPVFRCDQIPERDIE
ncbi:MAG: oxidoreductase [Thermoprotei archaeon]|nr:MAG: oxidoreductase [Thermoprotei archaeon]RLF22916.1 MAG: oxidoreductase [Thermoprotei archaeon]